MSIGLVRPEISFAPRGISLFSFSTSHLLPRSDTPAMRSKLYSAMRQRAYSRSPRERYSSSPAIKPACSPPTAHNPHQSPPATGYRPHSSPAHRPQSSPTLYFPTIRLPATDYRLLIPPTAYRPPATGYLPHSSPTLYFPTTRLPTTDFRLLDTGY